MAYYQKNKRKIIISVAKIAVDVILSKSSTSKGGAFFYPFNKERVTWFNNEELNAKIEKSKLEEFFEFLEKARNIAKVVLGGSVDNTIRAIKNILGDEYVGRIIPYNIDYIENEKIKKLFQETCKNSYCWYLKEKPENGLSVFSQIDIAEGNGIEKSKIGERYMYNHSEVVFPTLKVEEWMKILKTMPLDKIEPIILFEGYTFQGNQKTFKNLAKAAKNMKIPVHISLSAEFVVNKIQKTLIEMINEELFAEIYGNENEIEQLIRCKDIIKSSESKQILEEIDSCKESSNIKKLQAKLFKKTLSNIKNTNFIITRGSESTIAIKNGKAIEVEVKPLKEGFVNTLGAGDAFLAGFLSFSIINNSKAIVKAIEMGHFCASKVLTNDDASLKSEQIKDLKLKLKQKCCNQL